MVGVGQGSGNPPRLVKATYSPQGKKGSVAFVGKGVVFDSGGLSLKTSSGMETMKIDMSGAAAVLAAMSVLKDLGVKAKVTAYVPMVENMPSGTAIRPGDVLKIRNGKTVEVLNTDAEGRLILADALALAAEDKPDAVVDVATLTGACMVALGDKIAGLMGNRDTWNEQVQAAADAVGEPVWPLPMPNEYRKLLESEVADLRNISTGSYGGALTAALFLSEFVDGVPWVHLDIAGPARAGGDDGYLVKGGTGFAVRTLVELVDRLQEAGAEPNGSLSAMAGSRVRALRERLRERNPFPEGSATIGLWLIVAGVTAYLFLAVSGQVLGSEKYSALAVLWVIAFTAAPGFFQPLEQEMARAIAARRARHTGSAPVIQRGALTGGVIAAGLVIVIIVAALVTPLVDSLFKGQTLLVGGVGDHARRLLRRAHESRRAGRERPVRSLRAPRRE